MWLRDGPGTEKNGLLVAIFNPIVSKPVFRGRASGPPPETGAGFIDGIELKIELLSLASLGKSDRYT